MKLSRQVTSQRHDGTADPRYWLTGIRGINEP